MKWNCDDDDDDDDVDDDENIDVTHKHKSDNDAHRFIIRAQRDRNACDELIITEFIIMHFLFQSAFSYRRENDAHLTKERLTESL